MESNLCKVGLAALAAVLTTAVAVAAEPVALKPSPALAPDLAAFPRLVETSGDRAAKRINRALEQGDARAREAAKECRAEAGKDDYSRTITVTMRGPRYLSLIATDFWICGGAHPNYSHLALVYDLATGAPVNWKRLLPASLAQDTTTDTAGDGTVLGEVISPTLQTLYVQAVKAEPIDPSWPDRNEQCADVLANALAFLLWPDAEADGIVVQPENLPHVVKACGERIVIATPQLRKLGVDTGLLDAIEESHRQGWYDKAAN